MPRGGPRPNSGRKPGSKVKALAKHAIKASKEGITPLDYLLNVLRDETQSHDERFDAAKAAAPYMHPRLQAIEHSGEIISKHEQDLEELEKLAQVNTDIAAASSSDHELDELEQRVLN